MSIRPSPLLGYNNNVRHKGKVFHIQTEDSGARYGHIMTHLFADGGRILKSVKTSYAEYIGNERMSEIVREMMKQQHKAMFIALRDGKFDAMTEATVPEPQSSAAGAPPVPRPAAPPPPPSLSLPAPGEERSPPPSAPAGRPAGRPPPLPAAARGDRSGSPRAPTVTTGSAAAAAPAASAPESPANALAREQAEEIALDIGALERAAAVDGALPSERSSSDLPPPPAQRLRERTTGPGGPGAPPTPVPFSRRSSLGGSGAPAAGAERRYAPTRPASIFGQARPQHGKTIFGEDPTSDKSLDEVILSYLSDDLDDDEGK